tara:strand:+ start:17938 stop:18219 length:282 start_codon:yes stop_codon:yes gene_type:complete
MANFKPQVRYETEESHHDYYNASPYARPRPRKYIVTQFKNYVELKKELKDICEKNIDPTGVQVIRSRRGNWGEWFEIWELSDGEPTIAREGWM